jgi:hypothetical protein
MKNTIAAIVCILAVVSCSDDATGPVGGGDDEPTAVTVSYRTEADRTADAVVAPAGATIVAEGSDGVTYTLTIPAGALAAETAVAVTPVADLTVTGPGSFAGAAGGSDACVTGAVFAPDGLEFAVPASLTIAFPPQAAFPFQGTGSVFLFDSAYAELAPCPTVVDAAAKTLTATVRHFSGYGTGAPDCGMLVPLYLMARANAAATAGSATFLHHFDALVGVVAANRSCDQEGDCRELCEGLDGTVTAAALGAFQDHRAAFLGRLPSSPAGTDDADELIGELGRSVSYEACDFLAAELPPYRSALRDRIREVAGELAQQGRDLCAAGDCLEGANLLAYVQDLGGAGYVTDAAFLAQVAAWAADCCGGWTLTMSVDRTEIQRAVINAGDEANCLATVTLRLTGASGEPVAGVFLDATFAEGGANLPGGDSDENGEHEFTISSRALGYGDRFACAEYVTRTLTAEVFDSEQQAWAEAEPVVVVFRNFTVTTSVAYTYTGTEDADEDNRGTATCTINGGGTSYGQDLGTCSSHCSGVITRSYEASGCHEGACGANTTIGGAEVGGCLARPRIDTYVNDQGVVVPVVTNLELLVLPITADVQLRFCPDGEECLEFWSDLQNRVPWPGYGGIPEVWEIGQEPYTWTFSETSETSHEQASLTITVEAAP